MLDDEWFQYLKVNGLEISYPITYNDIIVKPQLLILNNDIKRQCDVKHDYELSISTKTKVLFLNTPIDINTVFWNIPIVEYWCPENGVIKKQMKIVSKTQEEYDIYKSKLEGIKYYNENIIKEINNPSARSIKFKDERKITIGVSKKDILSTRIKKKNAFYNCFALILRLKFEGVFKEVHVKVFNTGKMEIPGVVNYKIFDMVKQMVIDIIEKCNPSFKLNFLINSSVDHVLINSNFNCGFYIQRDNLHKIIISKKYEIESSYDPCSYPGVKCKFYFNNTLGFDKDIQKGCVLKEDDQLRISELNDSKKYTEVSFMIFRTGSCLVVGNCSEKILRFIFDFIKNFLTTEYENIRIINDFDVVDKKKKKSKVSKKNATFSNEYYKEHVDT
jgi:TATA-box binding protein (TBP) (component of TFIID and TFIIIB)